MKKIWLGILMLVVVAVGASALQTALTTDDQYREVANETLQKELERMGVRLDAFHFLYMSKHDEGVFASGRIYAWGVAERSGRVGVTISLFDVDFWGDPIIPNCHKAREETIRHFGEICS